MKRRAQPWLGTLVEIAIADPLDDGSLFHCFDSAFSAVAEVHRLMSFHDPASDVSRINRAQVGEAVRVDMRTYAVLQAALAVSRASGGIFDITCAPRLVDSGYLPAPEGHEADHVPHRDGLVLGDQLRVWKTAPLWIDLGGIAKGYAVDLAVAALERQGVDSACVNAGGDLRATGDSAYPVLVRDPHTPTRIARQIEVCNTALATSANYFSGARSADRSVLIDGRNGHACPGEFSVTVQAPTCMLADGLTKVVAASGRTDHVALSHFEATAFII